jgi:3-oxoacyl-[acyl-carrier-protein] synthase III
VRAGKAPRSAFLASGVRRLPVLEAGESVLHLSLEAAGDALRAAEAQPDDVELLLFCSSSYPNLRGVSSAGWLRERLGLGSCLAFGVADAQCAGPHVALHLVQSLLAQRPSSAVALIVSADAFSSRWIPFGAFLSDGASAMVIARGEARNRILSTRIRSSGSHGCAYEYGPSAADVVVGDAEVVRKLVKTGFVYCEAAKVAAEALTAAGLAPGAVSHAIFDGFSPFYHERLSSTLGVPIAAVCGKELESRGHTGTSDVAISLQRLLERGVPSGDRVLLVSVGLGFTFGSTVLEC